MANAVSTAPYADKPIAISVMSISTRRYKTYYCVECNHPFMQRDNDVVYRINNNDEPMTMHLANNGVGLTKCAKCTQKYTITISLTVLPNILVTSGRMQKELQSIYLVPTEAKVSRYVRCMDCGYSFCSLTDRISTIVDSAMPLEYAVGSKVAHVETRCDQNNCRQRWAIIV